MHIRSIMLGLVAGALLGSSALAADAIAPKAPASLADDAGFKWDGFYAGVHGGGLWYPDVGNSFAVAGAHVGINFLPSEGFLLGVEGSAEFVTGEIGNFSHYLVSGRAGALVTPSVLIYGVGGVGLEFNELGDSFEMYQLGAGVEFAVAESISIRGQLVGVGFFDSDELFPGAKATVGVSFHF